MNVRTRPSTRARVSRYAAFATAAGAASTASADVVIVDLVSPAGVGTPINLGEAVGRPPTAFMGVISSQGGGGFFGGAALSTGSSFFTGRWFGANSTISADATGGNWTAYTWGNLGTLSEGATGYLGFRLPDSGGKVYGWIEATVNAGSLQISRWAYETAVNTAIMTPAASGSGGAVPGLGGLAALACGAAGMRRSRNRVA
jgi:hypothetical protein